MIYIYIYVYVTIKTNRNISMKNIYVSILPNVSFNEADLVVAELFRRPPHTHPARGNYK